jgi:hypothetical protein
MDEFSVETIPRVRQEAVVIVDLTERLARRTSRKQIELSRSHSSDHGAMILSRGQIAFDELGIREVESVGRACVWVMVGSCQDSEPSVMQPLAKTARP